MAWIFQIWIESNINGESIRNYFVSKNEIKVDKKKYKIYAHPSGKMGSMITVNEISRSGIQSKNDADEMTRIGVEFYELLRNAPEFRYALVGVEVDEWRVMEELIDNPNEIEGIKGFVINEGVYRQINCKVKMEKFKSNYLWIPYEGEKYIDLKKNKT